MPRSRRPAPANPARVCRCRAEVKALAAQTAKATSEIGLQIAGVQAADTGLRRQASRRSATPSAASPESPPASPMRSNCKKSPPARSPQTCRPRPTAPPMSRPTLPKFNDSAGGITAASTQILARQNRCRKRAPAVHRDGKASGCRYARRDRAVRRASPLRHGPGFTGQKNVPSTSAISS